jgi:hypothetical protein
MGQTTPTPTVPPVIVVTGTVDVAVTFADDAAVDAFTSNPEVQAAFAHGLASSLGVDPQYVTVVLTKVLVTTPAGGRRLAEYIIVVTYTITVPSDAPASARQAAVATATALPNTAASKTTLAGAIASAVATKAGFNVTLTVQTISSP